MARDKIEVELLLNAKRAEATIKKMNRELDKMGKTMSRSFSGVGSGGAGDKVRALGSGLSKATVRADEFSKSLEASNARVIAFGASAGLIMNVDKAMRAMVSSTIKVEKALLDVNVVLNATQKGLDKFGKGMFKVAKETAQGFDTVAEAATELARQGLGMEKTLLRTKDALILTRLTGMNAADAVKSLTAAVNSFNKEGVTSAQVINRMAKVDAAFAVSSEDLAKSISRVGASAVSAGVSMNELMAITTAVQQKTARGGAVIGNAFKTIFTRLQRKDVLQNLRNLGVAVTDFNGNALSGIQVLQNLANEFNGLSKATQSSTAEQVAGVFQVNILKAALSDLSSANSNYASSLKVASTATDEAYKRNEQLNQSLDALVNRTLANLTAAGSSLGGALEPAIRNVLGLVNSSIEAFGKGGAMEGFGKSIGGGLIKGLGSFISGPGLVLVTAVFGKLALSLGKFANQAFQDILGINSATKQRAALEEIVVNTIAKEPSLLQRVKSGTLDILTVERDILATIRQQQAERKALSGYGGPLSRSLYTRGARVGGSGGAFDTRFGRGPGRASGFIPNFANPNAERAAAAAGGYTAGAIKTMRQPGAGSMMYNSAETVKQFPGMSQKAIMPPKGSPAGSAYKSAFGAAHGFNPYAAGGFVPNFAPTRLSGMPKNKISRSPNYLRQYQIDASDIGVILGLADGKVPKQKNYLLKNEGIRGNVGLRTKAPKLHKALVDEKASIKLNGVRIESFINTKKEEDAERMFEGILSNELKSGTGNIAKKIMTRFGIEGPPGSMGKLPPGLQGEVFEESMRMAMKAAVATPGADFDFEAGRPPSAALQKIFGQPVFRIDAKRRLKSAGKGEITKKYFNDPQTGKHGVDLLNIMRGDLVGGKPKALGFVPNFSPLSGAIGREMAAGVPASAIRVGSSNSLRGAGNPRGLGVYNTIHEPQGLQQGIRRSKSMGINPKSHGVPNFVPMGAPGSVPGMERTAAAADHFGQEMRGAAEEARSMKFAMAGMAAQMLAGSAAANMQEGVGRDAVSGLGSVAGYAGLGFSMGGPKGALAGGAIGVLGFGLDYLSKHTDEAQNSVAALSKKLEEVSQNALQVSQSMDKITDQLNKLPGEEDPVKRTELVQNIVSEMVDAISNVSDEGIRGSLQTQFEKVDLTTASVEQLKTLQKVINESAASQESKLKAELMGSNMRAADSSGVDFLSNRYNKGNYGQMASSLGLDISSMVDLLSGVLNDVSLGSTLAPDQYPSYSTKVGRKAGLFRQLNARQFGPQFAQELMGMQGTGGVPIGRLMMADEGTRVSLGNLEERFRKDPNFDSRTAIGAFEEGGVISEGMKGAGVNKELRNLIRKALDTPEARNIVLRTLFGMEMDKVETAYTDYMGDLDAVEANPGAKFSARQRALLDQPIGAAPVDQTPVRRGNTGIEEIEALVRSAREASLSTRMYGDETKRYSTHNARLRSIRSRVGIAEAGVGMGDQVSVANETQRVAINEARAVYQDRIAEGMDKFTSDIAAGLEKMGKEFQTFAADKKLLEGTFFDSKSLYDENDKVIEERLKVGGRKFTTAEAAKEMSQSEFAMAVYKSITEGSIDRDALQTDINEATKRQAQGTGTLGVRDQVLLKFGPQMINTLNDAAADYNRTLAREEDLRGKAVIAAKAQNKATQAYIELAGRYKRGEELRTQRLALSRSTERLGFIDQDLASGRITGSQAAALRRDNIRNSRDYMGLTEENTRTTAFRDEFLYGGRQALEEFEEGQRSVARSMKSSFAEAFQSISSGATTVQGALANMAQSILNSINQMSSQIFTNMMFAKMFPQTAGTTTAAHGGYIPGYAGGGLVTGGSGYKDDVLTKMQGGEFVIKKSAVNKIGVGNLNAINGYANGGQTGQSGGGPSMAAMGALAVGSGALSGIISAAGSDRPEKYRGRDYGLGRGPLGPLGGADRDAGRVDSVGGGGTSANVSLAKGFVYYRRDPETGKLISERARPTEGRFEVSDSLSLMGRLAESDPQTARMLEKEQRLGTYVNQIQDEKASRKAQIQAVKDQKRSRTIGAFMNAAMLIGGAKLFQNMGKPTGAEGGGIPQYIQDPSLVGPRRADGSFANGGRNSGSLARVMGGEYVMSPQAVRTHGVGFMTELNRGNVPGYADGGLVGGGGGSTLNTGGNTTNNVKINVNIDKNGGAEAEVGAGSGSGKGKSEGTEENQEIQNNAKFGEMLKGVVLEEIVKQQRPGGLLSNQN
jgi:TP901 family phage tail tape measure protein